MSDYPWFPSAAPYFQNEYDKAYVRDNQGTIWLVVHDGGMVSTVGYDGKIWSAGIGWLESNHGPLERI